MKIEHVDTVSIRPDSNNTRKHPRKNIELIKYSLEQFGQRTPLVVERDSRIIRKGNGTWIAAKELGWQTIAVTFIEDPALAQEYALIDNRTSELSSWEEESLQLALEALDESMPDARDLMAFEEEEIPEDEASQPTKPIHVKPPPKMAWVLIGIELERYAEIVELIESIDAREPVYLRTMTADDPDEKADGSQD